MAGLNTDTMSQFHPIARFHPPLVEPDRRISRIRLTDQTRAYAHAEMCRTHAERFTKPYSSYSFMFG